MEHETPPTPTATPHGPIPSPQHINASTPPSYTASPGPLAPPYPQLPPHHAAETPIAAYRGAPPPPSGAAPVGAISRPRTIENPEIALRERAVLAMLRGDEAPRSIAVRFGLPLEEIFYWLDVYREAGRRALAG